MAQNMDGYMDAEDVAESLALETRNDWMDFVASLDVKVFAQKAYYLVEIAGSVEKLDIYHYDHILTASMH